MYRNIFISILFYCVPCAATPEWFWMDNFSSSEASDLKQWISKTETGINRLFGPMPVDYQVYFYRYPDAEEPVPWANTSKHPGRSVSFYVDPTYSRRSFHRDWTAPHELTHLLFPFLGEDGRWFAEGIASYLQYQILYANETLSWDWIPDKLQERFNRAQEQYVPHNMSITELSHVAGDLHAWVRLYWGGAAYFLQVDKRLYETRDMRLIDVIRKYLHCCSQDKDMPVHAMMEKLDALSGSNIFSETYLETVHQPGFPETADALAWLRNHPPVLLN